MKINSRMIKKIIIENVIKNILTLAVALFSYNPIKNSISQITSSEIGDFLLIVSILLVTICFANFAFSYEYAKLDNRWIRILSHVATFIFMLLLALVLEAMVISINITYPSLFNIIFIFSVLLYFSIVVYDFWDLLRILVK